MQRIAIVVGLHGPEYFVPPSHHPMVIVMVLDMVWAQAVFFVANVLRPSCRPCRLSILNHQHPPPLPTTSAIGLSKVLYYIPGYGRCILTYT